MCQLLLYQFEGMFYKQFDTKTLTAYNNAAKVYQLKSNETMPKMTNQEMEMVFN